MKNEDFTAEMQRLAKGFRIELTKERIDAWWQNFGREARVECFRWAVTKALCDPRFPTEEHFLACLRAAAEALPRDQYRPSGPKSGAIANLVAALAAKLSMA